MKKYKIGINIVTEADLNMEEFIEKLFEMLNGRTPDWYPANDNGDLLFQMFGEDGEIDEIEIDGLTGPRCDLYVSLEEVEEVPE